MSRLLYKTEADLESESSRRRAAEQSLGEHERRLKKGAGLRLKEVEDNDLDRKKLRQQIEKLQRDNEELRCRVEELEQGAAFGDMIAAYSRPEDLRLHKPDEHGGRWKNR
jgi:cell division protein FtsB